MENRASVGFRLSPLQKLVWANPDLRDGTVLARVLVEGKPDVGRLRKCFEQVVEVHESLRTSFPVSPGFTAPFQVVSDEPDFSWKLHELGSAGPVEQEAEIQSLLVPKSWPASTPSKGPALAVKLTRVNSTQHLLALRAFALSCDTMSLENLVLEVASLYSNVPRGEDGVQYADFSEWHNEALVAVSEESEEAKEFWSVARLAQPLPLQIGHPPFGDQTSTIYPFSIDRVGLARPFSELETFFLGCWQSLLWRLTSQDFITVDVLRDGRPLDELRQSIGLFARPFPVKARFEDRPSFKSVFERLDDQLSKIDRWQAYSPTERPGGIGFGFSRLPEKILADDISFTVLEFRSQRWPFQLCLSCQVSGDTPRFELQYDSSKFDVKTIERLAKYFEVTVRAAMENDAESVLSFELLDESERRQLIEVLSSGSSEDVDSRTFHQLFEAQVALTPDRLALVYEKTSLTYEQLNSQANQIANWLRKYGVGSNVPVGLFLERSAEMIVAVLGILKAGGAYVPLLPDMPAARLSHQIVETGLHLVITATSLTEKLPEFDGRTLCLDRDRSELERESGANLSHTVTSDDLIYILYTSGSTGIPKGVEVTHGNVTNYVRAIAQRLGLHELTSGVGFTFATVSTLGADLGNTSIFPALVTGGCLIVIGYDSALDGNLFAEWNRKNPVDILKITPSNLLALLAGARPEDVLPRKHLIVGGESCTWDLARQVKEAAVCDMLNHYGPTEATIGCLTYEIQGDNEPWQLQTGTVPIGRPLLNVQTYILDPLLRPVPVGVPGEICISGRGIAKGYINRQSETREKFLPHPFLSGRSSLYLTGDLGRFLPDGNIEFLGRVDNQVKVRGYRVELTEIEFVLSRHPDVRQAIVLHSQDKAGSYLTAYLVASPKALSEELRHHLREYLPDYMVPRDFVLMEKFPLNANGKVDRQKLAEFIGIAGEVKIELLAPRTELEENLIAIWKQVLETDEIGIRDNFFELGGHSLLATLIIARIRTSLGFSISIRMLFEAPTVELLAGAIEATHLSDDDSEMRDLLAELEGLSDSKAEELLGGHRSLRSSATPEKVQ